MGNADTSHHRSFSLTQINALERKKIIFVIATIVLASLINIPWGLHPSWITITGFFIRSITSAVVVFLLGLSVFSGNRILFLTLYTVSLGILLFFAPLIFLTVGCALTGSCL